MDKNYIDPEFIAGIFQEWCKAHDINLLYTQPGYPTQNSFIERFNGSYLIFFIILMLFYILLFVVIELLAV